MEKSETVKKLGVQLVRIRNDWQSQTVPKDLAPAAKAKAVAEASKADRISELELELSRREAYESRLQQQLLVLKQQAGTGNASAGRGPITRQKRQAPTARPASAPRSASAIGGTAAPAGGPPGADRPSSARPAAAGGGGTEGGAGDMRSLLEMLQDKDRTLEELRARIALQEDMMSAKAAQHQHEEAVSESADFGAARSALAAGVSDGAVGAELRRQLKKSQFDTMLLEQRYQHLDARFKTLRENHEKVLSQMSDLNGALKKERFERSRLQQEAGAAALAQEEANERALEIESLKAELHCLQEENRRLISKAFSNDDAGEIARQKQELAMRDAKIKKLQEEAEALRRGKKDLSDATAKVEGRISLIQAEREEARRAERKVAAELGERDEEIERLKKQLALFTGDTGVPPQEIERALEMVRRATRENVDTSSATAVAAAGLRLVDTDLKSLGLSPLAKREVESILLQNSELITQLEKTELLLKNQTQLRNVLTAELEAAKKAAKEEAGRIQRREAQRVAELAEAKRQLLLVQESVARSGAGGRAGGGKMVLSGGAGGDGRRTSHAVGGRGAVLPLAAADTESIADSTISNDSEVDVRLDENIFELRVVRASLQPAFFRARPSTFCSFDFYQHDTQASPMRQGLEPEFDFTAQFVLEVNDLFLHYAATSVLAIELYQSLGVECALVARTDAPLRELLQGRRGKLVKHAQLYSVSEPSGASGAPQVVGTLVYEMRMRKKIDAPVHSFMQRFPDVATLALMPVRPGARTSEAIVTVRRASGLRLRAGGAGPPAPYVHFEFFEYGEHETVAKEGSHPTYEQEFRFPVERDGDFIEYLKQAKLRLNVFDENEEDTEAMIGYAELGLTPLLTSARLDAPELPLLDMRGGPAGALHITIELRDATQPKPISLSAGAPALLAGSTDEAAAKIQARYRGNMTRATGKGGMSVERPVPLVVGVKTLKLSDDVLRTPGLGAVWVEVDVLGLSREQLRTTKLTPKPTVELNFEASIPVKSSGAEADALRRALEASTPQDSDVLFTAMAQGASGPTQLGVGFVNLKELYTAGRELPSATVTLRGSNERRVGSLDISLAALGALHRASAADTVRVCVGTISLPDDIVHDPSVAELWVEVDLSCCAVPTALRTKAVTNQPLTRRSAAEGGGSTTLDFGFTHQVATPAGSAALLALQKALATKEESDSDVYFVLKARGKGGGGKGEARPSGADRELAEGYLNLEAMLKQGTDHINLPLKLERKGGGVAATLQVSLIAVEPLRRIQFPVSSSDAIRIDVGELTASEALVGDGAIVDVWVEIDVLDLDGGTPLRTPPLRKTAPKLDFNFSQTLTVDGDKLETLRRALEGPEQESDVYFVLKGRGPRVPERELAQGFINLQHLAQSVAKGGSGDVVRTKISLISEERKSYGNLVVSLVASELLTRARQAQLGGSKDAIRLELGALELAPIVRADASVFELWVEIDFLGMGEPAPLATARVPKGASATLELEYKHTIAVPPGSRQQATLKTA
ncbi:protein fantom isoform 1, partial [Chrysochromulina tobinii]